MAGCEGRSPLNTLPSDVSAWWVATGSAEFAKHPATLILPPPVYPWWEATGSAQFAASVLKEVPGLVITGSLDSVPQTTAAGQTTAPTLLPGPSLSGPGVSVGASTPQPTQPTTSKAEPSSVPGEISIVSSLLTTRTNSTAAPTTKMEAGLGSTSAVADAASATPSTPSDAGNATLATPAASSPTASSHTASSTASQTQINAASHTHSGKSARIVAGVVTPLVLLLLLAVALALYKRRRRARDRREWERTHEATADAVRQVGGTTAAPWSPPRGDVKGPLEGDSAPLFEKSAGTPLG
ncbi:hypothetical protein DFH08DRAFT_388451 [Mycena albidolilacea]|uniref:Uncharacterized protein n=1 Tax=Mycena albidolilacea TaxID=1033008 RepID=A0AAD6ZFR3_9AGAR|nr:hypothetical protein DFH08DRAFT_388451 [Mycena albidolilacea]